MICAQLCLKSVVFFCFVCFFVALDIASPKVPRTIPSSPLDHLRGEWKILRRVKKWRDPTEGSSVRLCHQYRHHHQPLGFSMEKRFYYHYSTKNLIGVWRSLATTPPTINLLSSTGLIKAPF